ncbi:CvpA family protein [Allosphingosinicella indica]|uniref:Membrane protein required for colicin V production n=1 Tax=Allosphingosinicella indica TaxID=941907 RepID=A0A1X7GZN1_9SPHN|nr:CvpA family protein [Allosphingosinicella indica]SMF76921.1 membrane protein required for colicin V production [Allosphingosinicella indica]
MGFTALDILVLLLVGGGAVLGFMRGFVCELLSLLAWVAAIVALKLFHTPVEDRLLGPVGSESGAAVLAFALIFGVVFIGGRIVARRLGAATRQSAVGPIDHFLGGGFGALKGLIGATLLYLAANLFYDTLFGRIALRPEWMTASRTYPLLHASGRAIVDFVEDQRGPAPVEEQN